MTSTETKPTLAPIFQEIKAYIDKKYLKINGFIIPESETQSILEARGAPIYGEIKYDSVMALAEFIGFTNQDVFYDFGSGVGKVALQIFLTTPAKKSVGIELSDTRYHHSQSVRKKILKSIKKSALLNFQKRLNQDFETDKNPSKRVNFKKKKLEFQHQNFLHAEYKDATVIFMASLCFRGKIMQELTDSFAQLSPGLRVISLKELPEHPHFTLIKVLNLPMSWSNYTPVYVYISIEKNKTR